jgi:hypothetical protein
LPTPRSRAGGLHRRYRLGLQLISTLHVLRVPVLTLLVLNPVLCLLLSTVNSVLHLSGDAGRLVHWLVLMLALTLTCLIGALLSRLTLLALAPRLLSGLTTGVPVLHLPLAVAVSVIARIALLRHGVSPFRIRPVKISRRNLFANAVPA